MTNDLAYKRHPQHQTSNGVSGHNHHPPGPGGTITAENRDEYEFRPPRNTQGSGSRHRRSLGTNVSEVVDHTLAMRSNGYGPNGSVGAGNYKPSFVQGSGPMKAGRTAAKTPEEPKDLVDVNDELEARLKFKNIEQGRRRGSGVQIGDMDFMPMTRPTRSQPAVPVEKNSLIEIGAAPRPARRSMSYEPSTGSTFHQSMMMAERGGTAAQPNQTNRQHGTNHSNRKMSLGLSYGPILASGDADNLGMAMGAIKRRGAAAHNNSRRNGQVPPGTAVGHGETVEQSWRQQVDAATARVAARQNSRTTTADSGYPGTRGGREDHSPTWESQHRNRPRQGGGTMPNTLTLDNWFSTSAAYDDGDDDYDHSLPTSQDSSRRNSHSFPDSLSGPQQHHQNNHPPQGRPRDHDHGKVELKDLDEHEQHHSAPVPTKLKPIGGQPFSLELATSIKMILFGATNRSFPNGWIGQSFNFNKIQTLRFGFLQNKGGPCGVLAAVQAYLIQALVFGNRIDDTTKAVHPLAPTDKERNKALASALVSILQKCSTKMGKIIFVLPSPKLHFSGVGRYKNDGITETLTIHEYNTAREALVFAQENIGFYSSEGNHAVIAFLYSAMLTRGFGNIREDMDSSDLPLMGAHGYCSQEMVNLLLTGKAVTNTFDGTKSFPGVDEEHAMILRGVHERSEIGLLTLFEHYQSVSVGENLKTPLFPIWLVCSESHYSVLFSEHRGTEKASLADRYPIHLNFYDGLNRQDQMIVLTVDCSVSRPMSGDSDLVPPLEHCLRTKWTGALIDWNGSEKIL